ncbi:MAG: hypothetical protein ABUT39_22515 [Acidobacteriota bacterium]
MAEAAVARLAEFVAPRAEFTQNDVYAALADAGIPFLVADRAFKFTQAAWGRVSLGGLGVHFAPDYLCLDGAGDVVESGLLAEEPYFIAAMSLVQRYAGSPGFKQMVLMSADLNVVNKALRAGSKPENILIAPVAFFMEPATQEGMVKAQMLQNQRVVTAASTIKVSGASGSAACESAPTKKPWWRFW